MSDREYSIQRNAGWGNLKELKELFDSGYTQTEIDLALGSAIEYSNIEIAKYSLQALNVDAHGLDEMDNKILTTIIDKFKGGPVGLSTLATAVSESGETIEEVYEPFLIQEGFIMRTPRGREVTEKAYKHLGRVKTNVQGGLF